MTNSSRSQPTHRRRATGHPPTASRRVPVAVQVAVVTGEARPIYSKGGK